MRARVVALVVLVTIGMTVPEAVSAGATPVAPPVVVTSSVAPSTVTAGQPTTISWQVTHGTTLTYNAVAVSGPGGGGLPSGACATPTQVSGTATDGYFHEVCTVPNGLANGTYQTHIQVTDNLGNLTFVSGPSFSVVNSTVVAPPVVVTSSVAPSTVTAGQPTTISWQVTHGATLTYNAVAVSGPGGSGLPFGACATPTQVSGTATDGYFHEVCTVPNGLANGTYQTHIQVTDNLGNLTFVSGPSFSVVNSTVVAPPVVVTSSVAPSTVTAGQPTTISWQVTHGATLTYNAVAVSGPGGSGLPFGACATPTQVSGTATDGYFHEVCTVPNGLANGTYQTHIQVTDNLGNLTFVSGPSFKVGLPPSPPTVNDLPTDATYGGSFAATVTTTGDGTTSVTSSSPGVCTVSGATVSYVGAGTCSLAAHVAAGAHYSTAAGSPQTFTVSTAATATSVSTTPTSVTARSVGHLRRCRDVIRGHTCRYRQRLDREHRSMCGHVDDRVGLVHQHDGPGWPGHSDRKLRGQQQLLLVDCYLVTSGHGTTRASTTRPSAGSSTNSSGLGL